MRDAQLAGDVARPDAELGQLDDADADVVGERPAVDEHAAQLVDLAILVQLRVCKSNDNISTLFKMVKVEGFDHLGAKNGDEDPGSCERVKFFSQSCRAIKQSQISHFPSCKDI